MGIFIRCARRGCSKKFSPRLRACPLCGAAPPPSPRKYLFRKKHDGREWQHHTGYLASIHEAEMEYGAWLKGITATSEAATLTLTLRQVADAYLAKLEAEGKRYGKKCALFLERMVEFWGDVRAVEITPQMVKAFQTHLRRMGASPAYCDRHLAIGKAAWNHSMGSERRNPFKVRFYHPDNTVERYLTPTEEKRLLAAAKQRHGKGTRYAYEIILLAIHTGMRLGDILTLHTDNTDFERAEINIRMQKRDLPHKIPMDSVVYEALQAIKPEDPGYYFMSKRTGKPLSRFEGTFAAVKKAAGINRPFRFHDLRHHAATKIGRATGNPLLVKALLGHRCISTTMRYFHPHMDDVREAMEKLTEEKGGQNGVKTERPASKRQGFLMVVK